MVVTDYNTKFVDKAGIDHAIEELKAYINAVATGDIDLSSYVTQQELQEKLDALHIDVDLSAYATKEEVTQAISNIDLERYATKAYVDDKVANIPIDGESNLTNYYTKQETYNKEEIDNLIPAVTDGKDGKDGINGEDGFSPVATVTKEGNTATITITDKNGTTTASISDGMNGSDDGSGSGGSTETYFTGETAIGTWIDGKPIYRKVIEVGKLGNVSSGNFGLIRQTVTDDGMDKVIRMTALLDYSTTHIVVEGSFFNINLNPSTNISTYVASVVKSQFVFVGNSTGVAFYYGSGYGAYECTMIIEYTKAS
ncbi:MAG: hypothetical protein NC412_14310 [Roseburia sp.]|nr:hypothetical protein [Roseburia sp.]